MPDKRLRAVADPQPNGALPPGWEHVEPESVADPYNTPQRRALVVEALRIHAEEMRQLDPREAAADPETAAMALDRADYALEAAAAIEEGEPEPFTRGVWMDVTRGPLTNHECRFISLEDGRRCDMAHLSERSAWIHSRHCVYRPLRWPQSDVVAALENYPAAYARRDPDIPLRDPQAATAALERLRAALQSAIRPSPSRTVGGIT